VSVFTKSSSVKISDESVNWENTIRSKLARCIGMADNADPVSRTAMPFSGTFPLSIRIQPFTSGFNGSSEIVPASSDFKAWAGMVTLSVEGPVLDGCTAPPS